MELGLDVDEQGFQSLFSWNLLLMPRRPTTLVVGGIGVSILVFVELALDGWSNRSVSLKIYVSILVFVELALDDEEGKVGWYDKQGFQSLFSWNLLLMLWGREGRDIQRPVSILVFVELALDAEVDASSGLISPVSILVFVELALDG